MNKTNIIKDLGSVTVETITDFLNLNIDEFPPIKLNDSEFFFYHKNCE